MSNCKNINTSLRFIDLFAGIGGIRKGFEQACSEQGIACNCVFTSEIKPHAIEILRQNNPNEKVYGDITQVDPKSIPNFDVLLGGFPCQSFSFAGKRLGFSDTRGTLFFTIESILKAKKPRAFLLENVEGLVVHDRTSKYSSTGNTFNVILKNLRSLGYKVSWQVLNAKDFGLPQDRKRVYITGTLLNEPNLNDFEHSSSILESVLDKGIKADHSDFIDNLLQHYDLKDLKGKSIKDKRGGNKNIHSWDLELKGKVSDEQKTLLNLLLKERRKKKWAQEIGIDWMDGMPLTEKQISTFYNNKNLGLMLSDLVMKRYLKYEYPKKKVGNVRQYDTSKPRGYNIVSGKMSYEVNKILDEKGIAPTLVAMDMSHLFVVDGDGIRRITPREGLRLFGFPEDFKFDIDRDSAYDLLGNTVAVPVIKSVSVRLLEACEV